jgi:hypothetical protein
VEMVESIDREMGERLVRALLPVFLHRVRNSTQLLSGIRSLLEVSPGDVPPSCADDLGQASSEAFENGWLLGVLASALGADVYGERERSDGLEPLLRWLREALLREQRVLTWRDGEVPALRATAGAPHSAAWSAALASLVFESCVASAGTFRLGFTAGAESHAITLDRAHAEAARRAFTSSALPSAGARLEFEDGGWRLDVPATWLEFVPWD